jgi:predicted small lipoprotein YifL
MRPTAFLLLCVLAGCGYKAPLYLPETVRDKRPVVVPSPAPDRPQPTEALPPPQ